eukprot:Rmarinus@m.29279
MASSSCSRIATRRYRTAKGTREGVSSEAGRQAQKISLKAVVATVIVTVKVTVKVTTSGCRTYAGLWLSARQAIWSPRCPRPVLDLPKTRVRRAIFAMGAVMVAVVRVARPVKLKVKVPSNRVLVKALVTDAATVGMIQREKKG